MLKLFFKLFHKAILGLLCVMESPRLQSRIGIPSKKCVCTALDMKPKEFQPQNEYVSIRFSATLQTQSQGNSIPKFALCMWLPTLSILFFCWVSKTENRRKPTFYKQLSYRVIFAITDSKLLNNTCSVPHRNRIHCYHQTEFICPFSFWKRGCERQH